MEDPVSWIEAAGLVERVGIIGLLALALVAMVKEWVVPRRRLDASEEQRKHAEKVSEDALEAARSVDEATKTVLRFVDALPPRKPDPGDEDRPRRRHASREEDGP